MSNTPPKEHVSVSVLAGPLTVTSQAPHELIGQQITMGDELTIHIRPETAAQWIEALTPIAKAAE
jgi:hypothetical protein